MFELHSSFDLLVSVSQFIYNYRQEAGISDSFVINPRIINQERGGGILFVWNDVVKDKPSMVVTNFGIYELETQKHTIFYTYEEKVKVVSCSVNPERTLLAFSIVMSQDSSTEKKPKDVYQAYLAELQSVDKTLFSLNLERSTFLKVQFLYPDQQRPTHNKDSEMLVFLHKESIGLYKVSLGRIGDKGIIMSGQPKTEQIVRKFVWCQWDNAQQRLHYIENFRATTGNEHQPTQKMSTMQFKSMMKPENMIDIPITFPFPYIRTVDKSHYGDIPLHPGIPELALNVSVLTQSNGAFCLCYHKQISNTRSKGTHQNLSDCQDVEYFISMIHHAKTLHGCVSNIPKDIAIQKRLVFSWLGSYLIVMLPGYFIHLLNVSPNFEPCHHILLHDSQIQQSSTSNLQQSLSSVKVNQKEGERLQAHFEKSNSTHLNVDILNTTPTSLYVIPIFSDLCLTMKTLLPCQSYVRESGSIAQHLYDYRSGCLMKLVINFDSMIESFRNAYWQTQLAILHYLILHNKDPLAVRKLFEVITEEPGNSGVNSMFSEYLVASTFAEMKKQVDKEILNLLSFTFSQTLRGQVEKNKSGQRLAHISYSSLEIINLSKRWVKDTKSVTNDDFWDVLFQRLRRRHSAITQRFLNDSIMSMYRQAELEEAAGKSMWNPMHVDDSFFEGIYASKLTEKPKQQQSLDREASLEEGASGGRSKLDLVLGPPPLFLQAQVPNSKIFKRRLSMLTAELLTKHLTKYLSKKSQSKAKNVASEYLHCQAKVSRQLCHLIWSLRGQYLSFQKTFLPNLQEPATDEEYELFQLYERFYLTVGDLGFPIPPSFASFFTSLGFKCLELHLFFQYVDRHILTLTPDFIIQLFKDLPDDADEEVPVIKFQIISRLPKPTAEDCFERWNHPITQQRKAREQVTQILLQGRRSKETSRRNSGMAASEENKIFPPLDTLMKHLEDVVAGMTPSRPISYDANLIESMALYNTRTKTNFDLSAVNF